MSFFPISRVLAACYLLAKPVRSTLDTKEGYKTKTLSTNSVNLTLTFAVSQFCQASHVDWAKRDPAHFVHGPFCHIIALHFGPQQSL